MYTDDRLTYADIRQQLIELLAPWLGEYAVPDSSGETEEALVPGQRYTRYPSVWVGSPPSGTKMVQAGVECVITSAIEITNIPLLGSSNAFIDRFTLVLDLWMPTDIDPLSDEEPTLWAMDTPNGPIKTILEYFDLAQCGAVRPAIAEMLARAIVYVREV